MKNKQTQKYIPAWIHEYIVGYNYQYGSDNKLAMETGIIGGDEAKFRAHILTEVVSCLYVIRTEFLDV